MRDVKVVSEFIGVYIPLDRGNLQTLDQQDKQDAIEALTELLESVNDPDRQRYEAACNCLYEILFGVPPTPQMKRYNYTTITCSSGKTQHDT